MGLWSRSRSTSHCIGDRPEGSEGKRLVLARAMRLVVLAITLVATASVPTPDASQPPKSAPASISHSKDESSNSGQVSFRPLQEDSSSASLSTPAADGAASSESPAQPIHRRPEAQPEAALQTVSTASPQSQQPPLEKPEVQENDVVTGEAASAERPNPSSLSHLSSLYDVMNHLSKKGELARTESFPAYKSFAPKTWQSKHGIGIPPMDNGKLNFTPALENTKMDETVRCWPIHTCSSHPCHRGVQKHPIQPSVTRRARIHSHLLQSLSSTAMFLEGLSRRHMDFLRVESPQ